MSLILSVGDVDIGRVVGRVRSGSFPRCSLARSPELSAGDVREAAAGARLSPGCAVEGVDNCARRDEEILTRFSSLRSDMAVDGVATRLFSPFS